MVGIIADGSPKSAGRIFVRDKKVNITSVKVAQKLGIGMVYQDQTVAGDL